jgi:hypothetical protein
LKTVVEFEAVEIECHRCKRNNGSDEKSHFKEFPVLGEAGQMPVDKDAFAFRLRQSDDFAVP